MMRSSGWVRGWVILGLTACGRGEAPPAGDGPPTDRVAPDAAPASVPSDPKAPAETAPPKADAAVDAGADAGRPTEPPPAEADAAATPEPSPDPTIVAKTLSADSLAYVARRDGPFPTMSDEGPRLVLLVDPGPEASISREALAQEGIDANEAADETVLLPVEAKRAYDRVGLPRVEHVWMFGPEGPCEAKLGPLYALAYEEGPRTLEMGHRLEACTETFAPVAYIGASPPPAAKWHAAVPAYFEQLDEPDKWAHPKRAAFEAIGLLDWKPSPDEPKAPDYYVRIHQAGPSVLGLSYAYHWPGPECEESETITQRIGTWTKGAFTAAPELSPFSDGVDLIGALYVDAQPVVIVGKEDYQMYLAHPTAGGWEWSGVSTGGYHDEDVAFSGWSVLEHYCGP